MTTEDKILLKILESQLKIEESARNSAMKHNSKGYGGIVPTAPFNGCIKELQRQIAELKEKQTEYNKLCEWNDIYTDFLIKYDIEITTGKLEGRQSMVFRDWLKDNYNPPTLKEKP